MALKEFLLSGQRPSWLSVVVQVPEKARLQTSIRNCNETALSTARRPGPRCCHASLGWRSTALRAARAALRTMRGRGHDARGCGLFGHLGQGHEGRRLQGLGDGSGS
eukprot:5346159-Prymnesium_polylepis.1